MRQMRKRLMLGACAGLLATVGMTATAASQDMPGEGETVTMARATWDTGWFHTEIYAEALRQLGFEIDGPVTLDNPPFYQAVSTGDVDLWVNGWFPLHNTYERFYEGQAELVGYVAEGGALQGYLVDKKTAEEHDITSIEDFKKDEIKEIFDSNGDGKADMVACPPGWGCEVTIDHHMDAYDLRDHVNLITAGYAASMADALARYQQGEPIFFYTWTPNWTVGVLEPGEDVVWLEVDHADLPEDQKDLEDATTLSGVTGCVADPCNMGWPANDIRAVANSEFLDANPAARKLLEVMEIPLDDIFAQNALMNDGEDSEEDLQRHAREWVANNQETFDGWLEEARSAAQ
ncbi:glycine betaine/L-proline ABC transporter substrate-binding protein ProX [Aquibaculum arenosum]|uniref:Glycine betaine/L-proline ABC transporter substrate-binding protein ProX n=1 Tax=Aquibaculum arenosum TaxID=3032591 RepID=A0ABT5YQ68_9PROT|nr:glycine betaine/L-proline ABC transporter substrate-binding protein ProX [Fodinicurvata sp. CAU 1616]MDF2097127.1 glycine betaine/L-proline ABC transporter substrate-binding protein ProX [Fodinicurvata sp. CAU 1616]